MDKVLDAPELISTMKERATQYKQMKEQLTELRKALEGIVNFDDFQGKGAAAVKGFYQGHLDVIDAWEQLIDRQVAFHEGVRGRLEDHHLGGNTFVDTDFLEGILAHRERQAKGMVAAQADALEDIFRGIDDIIHLKPESSAAFDNHLDEMKQHRRDTLEAVDSVDSELTEEYTFTSDSASYVAALFRELQLAATKGERINPLSFDKTAYHKSEVYQAKGEMQEQTKSYLNAKAAEESLRNQKEEASNQTWYAKLWEGTKTFTGELTGYYDYLRVKDGVDPVTGEELTHTQRVMAGGMAAAGFIPVFGWAGKAIKGGTTIYKTTKVVNATTTALDVYKTSKSLQAIKATEKGIYGLIAANGFSEYLTGKDVLGNDLTDSQRNASLSLGLVGFIPVGGEIASGFKGVTKEIKQKAHESVVRNRQSARSLVDNWLNGFVVQTDVAMAGGARLPINAMSDAVVQKEIHTSFVKVTKGIDNVKQGDKSSLAPGGGLNAHELKGGHLIDRHIGKTDEQLLDRLKNNPKITGSSTFNDRVTAEKVADTVLRDPKNIEKIQRWISDPNSRPTLPLKFKGDGEIIGRSATRNSEVIENVTNAKIILKKDNNGSFILTGYPVK